MSQDEAEKFALLARTMAAIARGRIPNAKGNLQRISRDELKTLARMCCERLGINYGRPT